MAELTMEQMQAELAKLRQENDDLRSFKQAPPPVSCKVGAKGGISVYGLGRWPVTLYRTQMERFLDHADQIRAFIEANADKLATKPTK